MSKESINPKNSTTAEIKRNNSLRSIPIWFDGKNINEIFFSDYFARKNKLIFAEGSFFTPDGKISDESVIKSLILDEIKPYLSVGITKKITNILDLLKISVKIDNFPVQTDRIHFKNGTLFISDFSFVNEKKDIVRSRFPINYNPDAPLPSLWLKTLDSIFYEEDIPAIQEFIGYSLIPSNKGQRMLLIKGKGGEGKSQIGNVIKYIFGSNAKDGSIAKLSEDRFARADLEHENLMIDDDMKIEALKHTDYIKKIVTSNGKMDLEKKRKAKLSRVYVCQDYSF